MFASFSHGSSQFVVVFDGVDGGGYDGIFILLRFILFQFGSAYFTFTTIPLYLQTIIFNFLFNVLFT